MLTKMLYSSLVILRNSVCFGFDVLYQGFYVYFKIVKMFVTDFNTVKSADLVQQISTKKQTGRTTRLLQEAINQAHKGKYVFVVAQDNTHRRDLCLQCAIMCKGKITERTMKCYPKKGGQITFETPESVQIDWERMKVISAHPSCLVLVDHYTLEIRFSAVIDMWQRFDA